MMFLHEIYYTLHFWQTWWFFVVVIIGLLGVIFLYFRYHIRLIQKMQLEYIIAFFANIAREFRSSLTLINGSIQEIGKDATLSERGKNHLPLVTEEVNNLLKVVTQLLDFPKLDKNKGQLKFTTINIVELISQRITMFKSIAERNQIKLSFHSEVESCLAAVDIDVMSKVMDNLIFNAIKHSYISKDVKLSFLKRAKSWVLSIEDKEIGISLNGQKQFFSWSRGYNNGVNGEMMGFGIGLLMVKHYVENHHGKVLCISKENVGSIFRIEIPYLVEEVSLSQNSDALKSGTHFSNLSNNHSFGEFESRSDLTVLVGEPNDPTTEKEPNDQFVGRALEIVQSNIANSDFAKDDFACEMNVSSSLLYKKIKSLTNQSPSDFIKTVRLKEAFELLKSRKYTITEVSELCGFSSVGYFSTVFKKYYHKTPSEVLDE